MKNWKLNLAGSGLLVVTLGLSACSHSGGGSSSGSSNAFASQRQPTGKTVFIFDPKQHEWALYDREGDLMRTGRASGGKSYCPDLGRPCRTVTGTFTAYREQGPECKSAKFPLGKGGSPMPNCMYFYKGYAIHGSYHVPDHNASHGCIRVTPDDAAWLNDYINPGATVIVRPYS